MARPGHRDDTTGSTQYLPASLTAYGSGLPDVAVTQQCSVVIAPTLFTATDKAVPSFHKTPLSAHLLLNSKVLHGGTKYWLVLSRKQSAEGSLRIPLFSELNKITLQYFKEMEISSA